MEGSIALERGQAAEEEIRNEALAAEAAPLLGALAADEEFDRPLLDDAEREGFIDRHFDAMDPMGG